MPTRWTTTYLVVIAMLAAGSDKTTAQVTSEWDRFKSETVIKMGRLPKGIGGTLASCRRPFINGIARINRHDSVLLHGPVLIFISVCETWRYLSCHDIEVLADGERVEIGESEHHGDLAGGSVLEQIVVSTALPMLERLGHAGRVDFRICNTEFTASPLDKQNLLEFAKSIRGAGGGELRIEPQSSCSEEQVSGMLSLGFSEQQVDRACSSP